MRGHFRPEFLNRVDEILFFHSLERSHLMEIARIQLAGLARRLADRSVTIELTEAATRDSSTRGTTRPTGRGRCGGRSSGACSIRSRHGCSTGASRRATRSRSTSTAGN